MSKKGAEVPVEDNSSQPTEGEEKKRRGRPPKEGSTPKAAKSDEPKKPRGRPPSSEPKIGGVKRKVEDDGQPKKRGRPRIYPVIDPSLKVKKPRGRPRKVVSEIPDVA